jgi:adenylate cyclase
LKLTPEDEGRLQRKYTSNLEAYGYFVRARELFMVRGDNLQARRFCEKAIALDPSYAVAYSLMGLTYWAEWLALANLDPQALEQAFTLARQALALDDSLPAAHELLGAVYLWRDKQYEQAIAEIERAITHHPHFFSAYYMLAFALNSAGRPEETIANAKVAMQLHPLSIGYLLHVGRAYFMLKRYEEAMAAYQKILATLPQHWGARLGLAMVYVELGREEEARAEVTEALRLYPQLSLHTFNERVVYKDPALSERTLAALRKAGLK